MVRILVWSAPKRDDDCDAGVPNGSWARSSSGLGDQLNSGDRNMVICI
jgi:hypothetical protein